MYRLPTPKPLPAVIIAVLAGIFLLPAAHIKAAAPFIDNFETYMPGNLEGQGTWETFQPIGPILNVQVIASSSHTGLQEIYLKSDLGGRAAIKKGETLSSGTWAFWIKGIAGGSGSGADYSTVYLEDSTGSYPALRFQFIPEAPDYNTLTITSDAGVLAASVSENAWHSLITRWDNGQASFKLDSLDWTASTSGYSAFTYLNSLAVFTGYFGTGLFDFYLDDIGETTTTCGNYHDVSPCLINHCYWQWGVPTSTSYCTDQAGGCGNTRLSCFNCHSTSTCLSNSSCYWLNDFCHFGSYNCGPQFPQIEFCTSSAACLGQGGYWYDSFCWNHALESFTSCSDYYFLHASGTPSSFYTDTCSSSSAFLGKIGGFITGLSENFDLQEAALSGLNAGAAIPLARSYLQIIDEIFGNLPISELLIVVLLFILALGSFKLFTKLAALFKFW